MELVRLSNGLMVALGCMSVRKASGAQETIRNILFDKNKFRIFSLKSAKIILWLHSPMTSVVCNLPQILFTATLTRYFY